MLAEDGKGSQDCTYVVQTDRAAVADEKEEQTRTRTQQQRFAWKQNNNNNKDLLYIIMVYRINK